MMPREQAERTAEALGGEIAAEGTSGDTRSASFGDVGDITTTAADRGTLPANITITSGSRTGTATVGRGLSDTRDRRPTNDVTVTLT